MVLSQYLSNFADVLLLELKYSKITPHNVCHVFETQQTLDSELFNTTLINSAKA